MIKKLKAIIEEKPVTKIFAYPILKGIYFTLKPMRPNYWRWFYKDLKLFRKKQKELNAGGGTNNTSPCVS